MRMVTTRASTSMRRLKRRPTCNLFQGRRGAHFKTSGEAQYLSDDKIIFMLFKVSFSDAISINEYERIYRVGQKKVSLTFFAITLSTAGQLS